MFDGKISTKIFSNHSELYLDLFLLTLIKTILLRALFLVLVPGLLVPNEGLVWEKLFSENRICHCNHNSNREIHADTEDNFFRNKRIVAASPAQNVDRPNCHSEPESPTHECSCKKEKPDHLFAQMRLHSHYIIASKIILSPIIGFSMPIQGMACAELTPAHGKRLKRPPKQLFLS